MSDNLSISTGSAMETGEQPVGTAEDISHNKATAKRKVAVAFGYIGTKFSGLQQNDGVRTVDEELEKALFKSGCIADYNHAAGLQKINWTRCSRTDKGVHAAINIISLKMMRSEQIDILDIIRSHLPDDIRLYGIYRVTKSFHSKQMTTSREYEYVLPTSLFRSRAQNGSESGTGDRINDSVVGETQDGNLSDVDLERFNSILSGFLGTKNYHNFSPRISSFDGSAQRYITKFEATSVICHHHDLISIAIHGQAFLLNQIRKMIGTALALYHGVLDVDLLHSQALFDPCKSFQLPMAPSLGLFLRRPFFRDYNLKIGERTDLQKLDFVGFEREIAKYINNDIYKQIIAQDDHEQEFTKWINSAILNPSLAWNNFTVIAKPAPDDMPKKSKKARFRQTWN